MHSSTIYMYRYIYATYNSVSAAILTDNEKKEKGGRGNNLALNY